MRTLIFLFLISVSSFAQNISAEEYCAKNKIQNFKNLRAAAANLVSDSTIDMHFSGLDIKLNFTSKYLEGNVINQFSVLKNIDSVFFNLKSNMIVDSIKNLSNMSNLAYYQINNLLIINSPLTAGSLQKYQIFYHGNPQSIGFGGFVFATRANGSPSIWSLSESFGAPNWWPCKDNLLDKIDSSAVSINLPKNFVSISNGILENIIKNADSTYTYVWTNEYPIAHYLISVACSDYTKYSSGTFTYNGKTMPVDHYIYPEALTATTKAECDKTNDMLQFFSDIFGEYPFINQKYGHANCGFSGGMEHQSITSMGPNALYETIIAHELGHQWFGDKITCETWSDIFLNEGFATYCQALYAEHKYGKAAYLTTIKNNMTSAKTTANRIYITDPENESLIFSGSLSYSKGAVILHMLRGILGDSVFFKAVKNYQNSTHIYGTATIRDFQAIVENTAGINLDYFFDEWFWGTKYPIYSSVFSNYPNNSTMVTVAQKKPNNYANQLRNANGNKAKIQKWQRYNC